MADAAVRSVFWNRWAYTVKVTFGEPWPRRRLTVTTSGPDAIKAEACVWRRAWNITEGREWGFHQPAPIPAQVVGGIKVPIRRPKHGRTGRLTAEAQGEPIFAQGGPVALQGLNGAGGQGDGAAPVLSLGRLQAEPRPVALVLLLDAALDFQRAAFEVDVAPLQGQQFAIAAYPWRGPR